MNRRQQEALVIFGVALICGAVFQAIAKKEAAVLGLSALELALLSSGVGALAMRRLG